MLMTGLGAVALLSAIFLAGTIPVEAAIAGGLVAGIGLATLFGSVLFARPGRHESIGSSYPVDHPSPAPFRSFWLRLIARTDEPVPIGA